MLFEELRLLAKPIPSIEPETRRCYGNGMALNWFRSTGSSGSGHIEQNALTRRVKSDTDMEKRFDPN
jgi:hypothetical protein